MKKTCIILYALAWSRLPWVRTRLRKIANDIVNSYKTPRLHRMYIMAVGFSKAGKHTQLANEEGIRIDVNDIHRRLNVAFSLLAKNDLVGTRAYWARQLCTASVRWMILRSVLQSGIRVVDESCNLRARQRRRMLRLAKSYAYTTRIVVVQCPENVLLPRLAEADRLRIANGQPPTWVKLYTDVQKPRFQFPHQYEADQYLCIFKE